MRRCAGRPPPGRSPTGSTGVTPGPTTGSARAPLPTSPTPPVRVETGRLVLRRPRADDAAAIFARYASDPAVTRWVGWPRHTAVDQTQGFLAFAASEWARWPAGPYLIERRGDGLLVG